MQLYDNLLWLTYSVPTSTTVVALLCLSFGVILSLHRWNTSASVRNKIKNHRESTRKSYQDLSTGETPSREGYGGWNPVEFVYPSFLASELKIEEKQPLPYRPFRWGAYHVTMGIRNMDWADWIEIDNLLPRYHAIRAARLKSRGEKAVKVLPSSPGVSGAGPAAREFVYELSEFLSRKYPETYTVTRHTPQAGDFGWYGDGQIKRILINPLDITYDLDEDDPTKVAALLIQDDFAIMIEGTDGRYYFQGGAILLPGFWRMEDKIGLPLEEIHTRGLVPQYREKLQTSLGRFFSRLPVDKPVQRNNYFFQVVRPADNSARLSSFDPDELAWSDTTNGDEDFFDQATKEPVAEAQATHKSPTPVDSVERIMLRTERQTLRRLPRTGAIIFTVRTYLTPVVDLAKEPGVPGRMASAIRSWPEDVARYKGQHLYKDAILPYLDGKHAEQVRAGVFLEDDRTSRYPC